MKRPGKAVSQANNLQRARQLELLARSCIVCGAAFSFAMDRGRPQIFCGDACRRRRHQAQVRRWKAVHRKNAKARAEQTASRS